MQSAIYNEPAQAFEGMVQDKTEREVSAIASELIYFGKAVSVSQTVGLNQFPPVVQGYTAGQLLHGIAAADPTVERMAHPTSGVINAAPYGAYAAQSTIGRLVRKGRVWVRSADVVDDLSKSVFIRNAADSGTAATITDTTTYPVADQDGLTSIVTLAGFAPQTVTFAGSTTTAAQVAAQMNAQLVGCSVAVVGGQVVITTDEVGSTQAISVAAGTGGLTWDTPVAGTGAVAILAENARGSFRATTASSYTEFATSTGMRWLRSATIRGAYYGLLEVNLP